MEPPVEGRILVVDDQSNMCWVIAKLLSVRGHEVRTAHDGAGALAVLADFDCQVAVVDYRLPDWGGLALIARMRELVPGLFAILMTSYGSTALRQRAMDEGVFAYLDKPFNNDVMISTIEAAVRAFEAGTDSLASGSSTRTQFPGRAASNL
jgi:DNA-binding NtrC family response regulator